VFVHGREFLEIVPFVLRGGQAFDVNLVGPFLGDALGPLDEVDPGIRPGEIRFVDKDDRLAKLGPDEGRIDVAEDVIFRGLGRTRAEFVDGVFMQTARRGADRNDEIEGLQKKLYGRSL